MTGTKNNSSTTAPEAMTIGSPFVVYVDGKASIDDDTGLT